MALNRIRIALQASLASFTYVKVTEELHAGDSGAEVHGDARLGRQGPQRQAYEVLSVCNELLCYVIDSQMHRFHRRLYAWVLSFPVGIAPTFAVAAISFGRLRRLWPSPSLWSASWLVGLTCHLRRSRA